MLERCDSSASIASKDYTLMLRDMASLTRAEASESLADPFGYGFSDSGIYTLIDGREMDMGVDWNEPLDVRARAVRRALRRRLGVAVFERYWCLTLIETQHSGALKMTDISGRVPEAASSGDHHPSAWCIHVEGLCTCAKKIKSVCRPPYTCPQS